MIDMTKKYKTRDGSEVRFYCNDGSPVQPTHGAIKTSREWEVFSWTEIAQLGIYESKFDLIEITPYEELKIDDPVVVWNNTNSNKQRAHFAGIHEESKRPLTYMFGRTSHTSPKADDKTPWDNCIHIRDYKGPDPI